MICYVLITKDNYLEEIKTLSCNSITTLEQQKVRLASLYKVKEKDIVITENAPTMENIKKIGIEIKEGFELTEDKRIVEMSIEEKIENKIIKLKKNQVLWNGEITTLEKTQKIVDGEIVEKTEEEKYKEGLITKEEYNQYIKEQRAIKYSKTDERFQVLNIKYNLKEISEKEYKEGLQEIIDLKNKIKQELSYVE